MEDNRVPWQINCDTVIKDKDNVILSSPTGSGKTKRYEIWALNKKERPIFITSPTKSLSNQRFRELKFEGYNVGLETGDVMYRENNYCDIICCTQEIYNHKYRDVPNSTLIIDEFSYIFEAEDRTRAYIDSLIYSKAKNILICSATFGNTEEIKNYVEKVTQRQFYLYKNGKRLTTLEHRGSINKEDIKDSLVITYSKENCANVAKALYNIRINDIHYISNKVVESQKHKEKEILELVNKYNILNEELIKLCMIGLAYYYGSLYPKEKLFVEELFERRLIDTVVGTDALALGVNFPIQNVIFTQLKKANASCNKMISKNLFDQISGRAGRKGYFDNGYVYYCAELKEYFDPFTIVLLRGEHLPKAFHKMKSAKNEDVSIDLTPNIKDILIGSTTIEEEARFIVSYSTMDKDYDEECKNINEIINYIKSFDVASAYLKRNFPNLNFDLGYEQALEGSTEKNKRKIDLLSSKLTQLQPYFDKYIGQTYMIEYSYKNNCMLLVDILLETPLSKLIKKYGNEFKTLLYLRKYILSLPPILNKYINLTLLDEYIDSLDHTVLHPDKLALDKKQLPENIVHTNRVYSSPNYHDRILINGVEYVKVLMESNGLVICENSKYARPKLRYIPIGTEYKLIGVLPLKKVPDLLSRIDVNSLGVDADIILQKIELEANYLKKKFDKQNKLKQKKKHHSIKKYKKW